jgi:hypothetical protein
MGIDMTGNNWLLDGLQELSGEGVYKRRQDAKSFMA